MNQLNEYSSPQYLELELEKDDAPELTDDWFKAAHVYDGEKLIRRGVGPHLIKLSD